MTAIDVGDPGQAASAPRCVTIVYRRGKTEMTASPYEQDLAQTDGVLIRANLMPVAVESRNGTVSGVTFEHTRSEGGKLVGTGETLHARRRQVFTAIGQMLTTADLVRRRRSRSRTAASPSTASAAPASPASGPAAIASPAAAI